MNELTFDHIPGTNLAMASTGRGQSKTIFFRYHPNPTHLIKTPPKPDEVIQVIPDTHIILLGGQQLTNELYNQMRSWSGLNRTTIAAYHQPISGNSYQKLKAYIEKHGSY